MGSAVAVSLRRHPCNDGTEAASPGEGSRRLAVRPSAPASVVPPWSRACDPTITAYIAAGGMDHGALPLSCCDSVSLSLRGPATRHGWRRYGTTLGRRPLRPPCPTCVPRVTRLPLRHQGEAPPGRHLRDPQIQGDALLPTAREDHGDRRTRPRHISAGGLALRGHRRRSGACIQRGACPGRF